MDDNYVYPATISERDGKYEVKFIDFPDVLIALGNTRAEVIYNAQCSLALAIKDYKLMNRELPIPSDADLNVVYIHVWLPYFNMLTKEEYVRKNVTIPRWLDILASKKNINFSAALVKGLKAELEIEK